MFRTRSPKTNRKTQEVNQMQQIKDIITPEEKEAITKIIQRKRIKLLAEHRIEEIKEEIRTENPKFIDISPWELHRFEQPQVTTELNITDTDRIVGFLLGFAIVIPWLAGLAGLV
jgi:hypothetical protein